MAWKLQWRRARGLDSGSGVRVGPGALSFKTFTQAVADDSYHESPSHLSAPCPQG